MFEAFFSVLTEPAKKAFKNILKNFPQFGGRIFTRHEVGTYSISAGGRSEYTIKVPKGNIYILECIHAGSNIAGTLPRIMLGDAKANVVFSSTAKEALPYYEGYRPLELISSNPSGEEPMGNSEGFEYWFPDDQIINVQLWSDVDLSGTVVLKFINYREGAE